MATVHSPLVILILVAISKLSEASVGYSYADTTVWPASFPVCAGQQQSPIDLLSSISSETTHEAFQFTHHTDSITENMTNTGHSLKIDVGHSVTISAGGLQVTYNIDQFHFHWGENSSVGSEHTIDSQHYPLELHVVAHNSSYSSFDDAKNHTDGLAVFGFLFEIQAANNSHLDSVMAHISDVHNLDDHHLVTFKLNDVIDSSKMTSYFRYQGSLTTPECFESVTWTVFDHTMGVSELQMEEFRSLYSDNGTTHLVNNFRPVQDLHGRTVHKYSYSASGAAGFYVNVDLRLSCILLTCMFFSKMYA
ncbi:carbonic anhydrase [Magallana gigas]|uniref:carbonic anhydrase n=1 Tax=Magallana gigas TaxID=29159 RepID=UPI00333F9104